MRKFSPAPLLIVLAGAIILLMNTVFVVPRTGQALVLQFGKVERVINAPSQGREMSGLYVKAPFVQNVVMFDRRNIEFNLARTPVYASDQEQLIVNAFARWMIVDPVKFYNTMRSEEGARPNLEAVAAPALRRVLGSAVSGDIISSRRAALMVQIRNLMNVEASKNGMRIIDVRISKADFPEGVVEQVYERMRSQRRQIASRLRAEGDEAAAEIRAKADREATVTMADAREQSEKTRGEGDAARAAIFSQSFGKDPEFAAFYRSLQAYEKAFPKGTTMVIPPEGEFFKYMNRQNAR